MEEKVIDDCKKYMKKHQMEYELFTKVFEKNFDSFYIDFKNEEVLFFKVGGKSE